MPPWRGGKSGVTTRRRTRTPTGEMVAKPRTGPEPAEGESRRMRILFLSPGGNALGGAERSLALLLGGLEARGHQTFVEVLMNGDAAALFAAQGSDVTVRGPRIDRVRRYGSSAAFAVGAVRSVPALAVLAAAIRRDARRWQADIVHSNGLRSHVLAPLLGRERPHVWSLLDHVPPGPTRSALQLASRATAAVVANSRFTAQQLRRRLVEVVPDPVEPEPTPTRASARDVLGLPPGETIVMVVAHLHPYKGHHIAIEALSHMPARRRPLLVLAGGELYGEASSRYLTALRELIARRALESRVRFVGAVAAVGAVYAAADVVIHPTTQPEAFGRVLIEAQHAGVPVIASAHGGPCEIIDHGGNGLLVEPGSGPALATTLERLLGDPGLAAGLAAQGRRTARGYSTSDHVSRIEAIYRRVLAP